MNILNSFDRYIEKMKVNFSGQLSSDKLSDGDLAIDRKWEKFISEKIKIRDEILLKGLPKRTEESWKYTSIKFLNDLFFQFELPKEDELSEKLSSEIKAIQLPNVHSLVFVNGIFLKSLSHFEENKIQVECFGPFDFNDQVAENENLNKNLNLKKEIVNQAYSNFSFSESLKNIRQLYLVQQSKIIIKPKQNIEKLVQIINYTFSKDELSLNSNPQLEIIVQEQAKASILFTHQGPSNVKYFSNGQLSVKLAAKAHLELINETKQSFQSYHMDQVSIDLAQEASLVYLDVNLSSLLSRHELKVNLNAQNSEAKVLGVSLLQKTEHCDHQTQIHFQASRSSAVQLYKSIVDDLAHSVFSGTVYIDSDIEGITSSQLNHNVLLSDKAESNSKPILMIYSDDVKASHGSTVGQLNKEELFYLQSRSISTEKAKELLSIGFLLEVIEEIELSQLKIYLKKALQEKYMRTSQRPILRNLQ